MRPLNGQWPAAVVVMEACGRGHHWARMLMMLGHEVKLIAPQYARPFVKRQRKLLPLRHVSRKCGLSNPKPLINRRGAILFRSRERIVHQRTELVNALRAVLYEYGHVVPVGIGHVKRLEAILEDTANDLPDLVREEGHDLLAQICEKTVRIDSKTQNLAFLAKQTDVARRLQTMPGIGPMTAVAVEAFAPAMESFKSGRLCRLARSRTATVLVRRQGKVSKAGHVSIRRLLIIDAMARVNWASRKETFTDPWMMRMLGRKPRTQRLRGYQFRIGLDQLYQSVLGGDREDAEWALARCEAISGLGKGARSS